jgi:phosphorylcholine metabolism protein LicD
MKEYDNSEKTARLMLDDYVKTVTDELEDSIEAIILLGSLVYGGYIPGPGDIDQITILKNDAVDSHQN